MYNKLENLNISLINEKIQLFEAFSKLFLDYNSKVNLISKNDEKVLFEKHIYDSLSFNLFFQKYIKTGNINLLDIGTGGGFPSLPLSILYDDIQITALDSIQKKINFINYAASELKIKNIKPLCSRVEDLSSDKRSSYDVVVTRAMAELRTVLEYAIPYIKVGGYFVAYKSIKADDEIQAAKKALMILNSCVVEKIEYSLPVKQENKRLLIVIKKQKEVPCSYPRKNGQVKKNPL